MLERDYEVVGVEAADGEEGYEEAGGGDEGGEYYK